MCYAPMGWLPLIFHELAKSTYAPRIESLFDGYGTEVAKDTTDAMVAEQHIYLDIMIM